MLSTNAARSNPNKTTRAIVAFVLVALVIVGLFGTNQDDKPVRSFKSASVNSPKTDLDEKIPARVDTSGHPLAENEMVTKENHEASTHSVVEDSEKTLIDTKGSSTTHKLKLTRITTNKKVAANPKETFVEKKEIVNEKSDSSKHVVVGHTKKVPILSPKKSRPKEIDQDARLQSMTIGKWYHDNQGGMTSAQYSVATSKTLNRRNIRLVFDGPDCQGPYARVEAWYNNTITHTNTWGVLADCNFSSMTQARRSHIVTAIAKQVGYSSATYVNPTAVASGFVTAPPHRYHVANVSCPGQSSFCGTCFGVGTQKPCLGLKYPFMADMYVSVGKTLPSHTACAHATAAELYGPSSAGRNCSACYLLNPIGRSGAVSMQGMNAALVSLVVLVWWI